KRIAERMWEMLADTPRADREAELITLSIAAVVGGSSCLLDALISQSVDRGRLQPADGDQIGVAELEAVVANEESISRAIANLVAQAHRTPCEVMAAARWLTFEAAHDLPASLYDAPSKNGSGIRPSPPLAWNLAAAQGVAEALGLWLSVGRDRGMPTAA